MSFKGVYVHIPFCLSKCIYCDFVSGKYPAELRKTYLSALLTEIESYSSQSEPLISLYLGGGTPSLFEFELIEQFFIALSKKFKFSDETEISIEANPESVNPSMLEDYCRIGINRLSIGIQSLNDKLLEFLGRKHSSNMALLAIEQASQAGFANINADLLLGIPLQSKDEFLSSISILLDNEIEHISIYQLMVTEHTPLQDMISKGLAILPADEYFAECYLAAHDLLKDAGFEHYEVSNWAKPGFESKHNKLYWEGHSYLGLGAAAHSYDGVHRWANLSFVKDYITAIDHRESARSFSEKLTPEQGKAEKLMLRLRTKQGLTHHEVEDDYPALIGFREEHPDFFLELDRKYVLNPKGWLFLDEILMLVSDIY